MKNAPAELMPKVPEKIELSKAVQGFINAPIVIQSNEQNLVIANNLALVKGEKKRLDADRRSFTDPINKVIDAIIARYKLQITPLENYETAAKNSMANWDTSERNRIAAENEKLRQEAAEKARKDAEKLEKKAEKAEAKGNAAAAEELRQMAENVQTAPVPVIQQQKASGVSFKTVWDVEITDASKVPGNFLMPDIDRIKAVVGAMAGKIEIPGVKVTARQVVSSRSV